MNPWWTGAPHAALPSTERHLVFQMDRRLEDRLAPIVVVRGPRQIGKTTAQMQVLSRRLRGGIDPRHVLRVQWDDLRELAALRSLASPILRVVDGYEQAIIGRSLNSVAQDGAKSYLFFDEVQNVERWSEQLEFLVDHTTTQVVVTGSSALRIERGRDSLAGRITTIDAGVLSLTEIASFRGIDLGPPFLPDNGLEPLTHREWWLELREHGRRRAALRDQVFERFSERGGYPVAHERADVEWAKVADQLDETVIRRVIQHDLRVGSVGRKRDPQLLEELFGLACRYAGEAADKAVLQREAQLATTGNVGAHRVANYLRFLGDTLLLRLIEPLEIRLEKRRAAPKPCLADHALRASWLQEVVPIAPRALEQAPHLTTLAGHIAESVTGAALSTIGHLDLSYSPERPDQTEVDFVLTVGVHRIPLEVKYQRRLDPLRDTLGLRAFIETSSNNAPFGVLVTQTDGDSIYDPRIVALPLASLLLMR